MINFVLGACVGIVLAHGYWLSTGRTLGADIAKWWRSH